mmetsp:Transcript_65709/g.143217  ORF Transcript_65709/g.143217 Transcript_65709/m.143217 type:complete len:99 (+) Transcript_65709:1316-1612(+)
MTALIIWAVDSGCRTNLSKPSSQWGSELVQKEIVRDADCRLLCRAVPTAMMRSLPPELISPWRSSSLGRRQLLLATKRRRQFEEDWWQFVESACHCCI